MESGGGIDRQKSRLSIIEAGWGTGTAMVEIKLAEKLVFLE